MLRAQHRDGSLDTFHAGIAAGLLRRRRAGRRGSDEDPPDRDHLGSARSGGEKLDRRLALAGKAHLGGDTGSRRLQRSLLDRSARLRDEKPRIAQAWPELTVDRHLGSGGDASRNRTEAHRLRGREQGDDGATPRNLARRDPRAIEAAHLGYEISDGAIGARGRRDGGDAAERRRSRRFEARIEGERRGEERGAPFLDACDEGSRSAGEIGIDFDGPFGTGDRGGFAQRFLHRALGRNGCTDEEREPHGGPQPIRAICNSLASR